MPASEPHSAAQPEPESAEGQRADLEVMRRAFGDADNPPSFHHIVTAWKRSQRCEDPDLRRKYAKLVPHLLEAFEITRKRVISAQLYERTCAVAVLTDTDEAVRRGGRAIHLDPGDVHLSDAHTLRAGCQDLHNRGAMPPVGSTAPQFEPHMP